MKFICFSSGAQRRYRDDIVRAMAMPVGCELTFRYRLEYIAPAVLEHLKAGKLSSADQVLISYLDQSDRAKPVDFIPVRFAQLIEAPVIGDFVVLRMRIQGAAFASDLSVFNQEIRARSAEVPKWPDAADATRASGSFWIEVDNYPKSLLESRSTSDWQTTVGKLLAKKDFGSTGALYQIVELQELKTRRPIAMVDGQYRLRPGTEYELQIDHFLPSEDAVRFQLETALAGSGLAFISGATMQIDSSYDRHWVRFKTLEPLQEERAVITVNKKKSGEDAEVQFDLPILVGGRIRSAILVGIIAGVLLALPQITTTWMNPGFATKSMEWFIAVTGFIAILNIIVGVAASLNFRKPI